MAAAAAPQWTGRSLQRETSRGMPRPARQSFLEELSRRCGPLRKLGGSQSLFSACADSVRIYVRYSRVHGGDRTFYGLREDDLRQLQGRPSVICFLWDEQEEPLIGPYADYEDVFQQTTPASDGQFKAQVYLQGGETELYIAQAGRFAVDGSLGWGNLESMLCVGEAAPSRELSHSQAQTLLGAIGVSKGYDVWIPPVDRPKLDWSLTPAYECRNALPGGFDSVEFILQEIDMIWVHRGSSDLRALFEVEHSTPIYSGLLRFNDIRLVAPALRAQFTVVAEDARRPLFVRQVHRPTFRQSGLVDMCAFLDYTNVCQWHTRILPDAEGGQ